MSPGPHLAFCTSSSFSFSFCENRWRSSPAPAMLRSSPCTTSPNLMTHVRMRMDRCLGRAGRRLNSLSAPTFAILLLQEACRTCGSSGVDINQCLSSAVVSHTSLSVRQREGKHVCASSTRSCRPLPVLVRVAALRITYRTSADGGVPAKQLSVRVGSISRATNRLRTSTGLLSRVLMTLHRQEIGLRPVLFMRVSSVTSSWVVSLSLRHFLHACFCHILSHERYANHCVHVISFAIVHVHSTFVAL